MKPQAIEPQPITLENTVLQACRAAAQAERDYAQKAVIAGIFLIEYRAKLACICHDGNSRTNSRLKHNNHTPKDDLFLPWLESHGIPQRTAYRWMQAAERVARLQLNIQAAVPFTPAIEVDGTAIPLSQALTCPEAELPDQARSFRQAFFDFMADKTIAEACRAAVEGESPAYRISRAGAGKLAGGSHGEDRKAYHLFIAEKLGDISTHLKSWHKLSAAQREAIEDAFSRSLDAWPSPLLEHLVKHAKLALSRR
jgi:hypothetical protein